MALKLNITRQMQYAILGVLAAVVVLFAAVNFLVVPLLAERKANLASAREIRDKLEEDRRVIKTRQDAQRQLDEIQAQIVRFSAHIPLPVLGNFLLGMEARIRACAKGSDIDIIQVANEDVLALEGMAFKVYRVRVTAKGGLRPLISLFESLQNSNPLLSIAGLTIVAREDSPEKHDISFTVAWLVWVDPAKRPAFLLAAPAQEPKASNEE